MVRLFQKKSVSELKRTVSEPIDSFVTINDIKSDGDYINTLDEQVIERRSVLLKR